MVKLIKILELHSPMIQFLIKRCIPCALYPENFKCNTIHIAQRVYIILVFLFLAEVTLIYHRYVDVNESNDFHLF